MGAVVIVGPRSRRIARATCVAIAGMVVVITLVGCTTMILTPRVQAGRAETVYLIDYGRHSSLVFPPGANLTTAIPRFGPEVSLGVLEVEESLAGHAVEYAYGEWDWFARNKDGWPDLFRTMLLPTQGTLGRRDLGTNLSDETLPWKIVCEAAYPIEVDRDRLAALRERLDERFAAHSDTRLTNSQYMMDFVYDEAPYSLMHNCNHVVVEWLRDLGCEVRGAGLNASFKVVSISTEIPAHN